MTELDETISRSRRPWPAGTLERGSDILLDVALAGFAAWTALYHLAQMLDLSVDLTMAVWVVVLAVCVLALVRLDGRVAGGGTDVVPGPRRVVGLLGVGGGVAGLVAGLVAIDTPGWWLFWIAVVALLAGATVVVVRARPEPPSPRPAPSAAGSAAVLAVAIVFAGLSVVTLRPDADDVLVVNRSVWVEERGGAFPDRDVLFSDEVFSITRAEDVDTSIEPFIGSLARWSPWSTPTVAYLGIAPVVSFLAVLALWRLLRTLRSPAPVVAAIVAALFLAFDGAVHTSFGNFSFGRAWQGKVILVAVVVPLLWHFAVAWTRGGSRRELLGLVTANVAAVGLSSTAVLVAPIVTVLGALAGGFGAGDADARRRVVLGLAPALVPVGAGLVALVSAEQSPLPSGTRLLAAGEWLVAQAGKPAPLGGVGGLGAPDPWFTVLGTGVSAVVAAVAALTAWLATRDRSSRLVLTLAPLVVVGFFGAPGVLRGVADLGDARSIVWRVMWIVPVPAAVGLVSTLGWSLGRQAPAARVARAGIPVVVVGALLVGGTPIWSGRNGADLGRPRWDLDPASLVAAQTLIDIAGPGATVAAPEAVGGAMAIVTVDVRAQSPRNRYVGRGDWIIDEFRAHERRLVSQAVESGGLPPEAVSDVRAALVALDISAACVRPGLAGSVGELALVAEGFDLVSEDAECRYWSR